MIWSKVFSMLPGIVKMSPRSAIVMRLAQIDAQLEAVRPVERGDLADALRAEAGARAVGGAAVERGAEHGDVVLAAAPDVLQVRRLEEGVDAGEVRQLAAGERRDPPVDDRVGAGQPHLQPAGDLLLPLRGRQAGLGADGERRLGAVVLVHLGKLGGAVGRLAGLAGVVMHRRSPHGSGSGGRAAGPWRASTVTAGSVGGPRMR